MTYTLITRMGTVYTFYVKELAQTYQNAYGGVLMTNDILVDTVTV